MAKPKARELHPQQYFPRCEAEVGFETLKFRRHMELSRGERFTPQCRNMAKYEVGGKMLCGRHAGVYALNILLGKG